MSGAADHAIKVFGETDNHSVGVNGAIKINPVMSGGKKKNKNNKSRGGKNNKSRGGKNNKSQKNKSQKNKSQKNKSQKKVMRGGK